MKNTRLSKILDIIKKYIIETQEELADKLRECGIEVTQATVSRDIKELGLIKAATEDGKYKYMYLDKSYNGSASKLLNVFLESLVSLDYASNLIIIKTLPGMGQAAASAVDSLNWTEILGTVAGDDTILVVAKSEDLAKEVTNKLKKLIE